MAVRSSCLTQPSKGNIGHLLRHDELEKTLILGMVVGKRSRGRPKMRLGDHLKDVCGKTLVEVCRMAKDTWGNGSSNSSKPLVDDV